MPVDKRIKLPKLRELINQKKNFLTKVVCNGGELTILFNIDGEDHTYTTQRGNTRIYKSPSSLIEFLYKESIYQVGFDLTDWDPSSYYNASGVFRGVKESNDK